VRRTHGGVVFACKTAEFEVEVMELESDHELTGRLRFKAGQPRIAQLLVRLPIALGDRIEQPLVESQ